MVPIRGALEKLATDLGKTYSDYNKLCEDNDIIQVFHNLITSFSFDQKTEQISRQIFAGRGKDAGNTWNQVKPGKV